MGIEHADPARPRGPIDPAEYSATLAAEIAAALVEPVARRVVELLREDDRGPRMLTAIEAADRLGVSRDWVYAHRSDLGAVRLGDGDRPRLRFPVDRVDACLASRRSKQPGPAPDQGRRRRRKGGAGSPAQYLPVRGRKPA